jgi:hypothetical protein
MGAKGKEHAEHDRKEHHKVWVLPHAPGTHTNQPQVKELLKEFQNMSAGDSAYVPKLKEIWGILEHHIETEESEDLPALEKALSSEENRGSSESLAKNFGRTKAFVPSRSHPAAGENPYVTPMYELLRRTLTSYIYLQVFRRSHGHARCAH